MRSLPAVVALLLLPALTASGQAFEGPQGPIIARGVSFLKAHANDAKVGEAALAGLALVKCDVPPTDPVLTKIVGRVLGRFKEKSYAPDHDGGSGLYEAAVAAMLLANVDPVRYRDQLQALGTYLVDRQLPGGGWDYKHRQAGDTSISQYAVLGLWEVANGGVDVAPEVWDSAAGWFAAKQAEGGSWNYHRDEPQWAETIAMTAAGVGSLLICQRQLRSQLDAFEPPSPLLTPVFAEGRAPYEPKVTSKGVQNAARRGGVDGGRFVVDNSAVVGQSPYYALYGVERVGALGTKDTLGGIDWYRAGFRYIQATQRGDGSWTAQHDVLPNTSWALLFLTKSTAKTIRKIEIKRLSAGTLLGGRGLPTDLSTLTVAGGRVLVRPMNGAIDEMLAVLEDPRSEGAESALAGLVGGYARKGPDALRPLKDRFRKLLADPEPGNRATAAWALGRIDDLDAAPALIGRLEDPDDAVVEQARLSLLFLSRKVEDTAHPGADAEAKAEAARRWRSWYDAARPPGSEYGDGGPDPGRRGG